MRGGRWLCVAGGSVGHGQPGTWVRSISGLAGRLWLARSRAVVRPARKNVATGSGWNGARRGAAERVQSGCRACSVQCSAGVLSRRAQQ